MKIKRSQLVKMVKEELSLHIKGLMEAPANKTSVVDAGKDKKDKKLPKQKDPDNTAGNPKSAKLGKNDLNKTDPKPAGDDPADKDLESDVADEDTPEDAKQEISKLRDELSGKTVQSITQEPKSKILPGAQEVVITFDQTPDPLKILITKTGVVKYFWKGSVHNTL